jgi:hypothetical protein
MENVVRLRKQRRGKASGQGSGYLLTRHVPGAGAILGEARES